MSDPTIQLFWSFLYLPGLESELQKISNFGTKYFFSWVCVGGTCEQSKNISRWKLCYEMYNNNNILLFCSSISFLPPASQITEKTYFWYYGGLGVYLYPHKHFVINLAKLEAKIWGTAYKQVYVIWHLTAANSSFSFVLFHEKHFKWRPSGF